MDTMTAGLVAGDALLEIDKDLIPLIHVPAECSSLTVDLQFEPFIGKHIGLPANLQHLAVSYGGLPTSASHHDPLKLLPNLGHMTQLKTLKVEAPDVHRDALVNSLAKCPGTLTSCYIGGWGNYGMNIRFYPEVYQPVQEHLRRLTKLELHFCRVYTPKHSITCLEDLTSLSITNSEAELDFVDVTKLTNLIYLDLTNTYSPGHLYDRSYGSREDEQSWSNFEAWPRLHVFKFAGCWLIDDSTIMDVATVAELYTDRLTLGMEVANIHLILRHVRNGVPGTLASLWSPVWYSCIVDLRVDMSGQYAPTPPAPIMNQVLATCLYLQTSCWGNG